MSIENKKQETVFTREEIRKRTEELGVELSEIYKDKQLLVVSLLKGSFIFTADLVREITVPVRVEFMTTSSYGHGEESTGTLNVIQDLDMDLSDYDVLIVDDIVDSAITMTSVIAHLSKKNPKSIKSCVLLDKPERRRVEYSADYVGFEIPDMFIVGYGLNYGDHYRNIPYVFAFVD